MTAKPARRAPPLLSAALLLVLLILATSASAYPFGKGAAVTEVTPTSFTDFVNTHKPVVLLFYAPWCGHCKNFEPEFIRFAESVKGTVRVGAINADAHASFGQQHGVRGFPTIKYWKAGKKVASAPQEYQGPRTAAALQQLVTGDITEGNVDSSISAIPALESLIRGAALKRAAVLFSRKSKVPAMFSVLSLSRQLQSLPFVFIGGETSAAATIRDALGVTDVPAVALVAWNATSQSLQLVPYPKKKMLYEPIAKFFLSCLRDDASSPGGSFCGAARGGQEAHSETDGVRPLDGDTETGIPVIKHAPVRLATPVGPIDFSAAAFTAHCSPASPKVAGVPPLCVIFTTPTATEDAVTRLHSLFAHEPVIVFSANTAEARGAVVETLSTATELPLDASDTESTAVLAFRHARPGVIRFKRLTDLESAADSISRILAGDVRLDTWRAA